MKRNHSVELKQEEPPEKDGEGEAAPLDLVTYNKILEKYLNSTLCKPQLTVSNIEDGSYLLRMNVTPFPPLTCLMTKMDWVTSMTKVSAEMKKHSEVDAVQNSSHTSTESFVERERSTRKRRVSTGAMSPCSSCEQPPKVKKSLSTDENSSCTKHREPSTSAVADEETTRKSPSSSPRRVIVGGMLKLKSVRSPPPSPTSSSSQRSRRPLRVRFHRLGVDNYKVTEVLGATAAEANSEKGKRASNESFDNEDEMTDDGAAMDCSDDGVPGLLNGVNGARYSPDIISTTEVDVMVILSARGRTAGAEIILPLKYEIESIPNGQSNGSDAPAQSLVMHHTWKQKQRRGDPVKVTSYVKRLGSPVYATFHLGGYRRRKIYPKFHMVTRLRAGGEFKMRQHYYGYGRCRSVPPTAVVKVEVPDRDTQSVPVHPFSDDAYHTVVQCEGRPMGFGEALQAFRSYAYGSDEEQSITGNDVPLFSYNVVKNEPLEDPLRVVKMEPLDEVQRNVEDEPMEKRIVAVSPQMSTKQPSTDRRGSSRQRRLRPRAGRRTGELVTVDDQVSSDPDMGSPFDGAQIPEEKTAPAGEDDVKVVALVEKKRGRVKRRRVFDGGSDHKEITPSPLPRPNSGDAYLGDDDEEARDGLRIADDEPLLNLVLKKEPIDESFSVSHTVNQVSPCNIVLQPFQRADVHVDVVQLEQVKEEQDQEVSDARSESDVSRFSLDRNVPQVDPQLEYRYLLWAEAYKKFRTDPYISTDEEGKVPQFIRYPPRSTSDVNVVIKHGEAFALLRGRFEVKIKLPVKEPKPTNWKEILVGDVVWVRWRKNEHWPATVYEVTDKAPVKVTVYWVNDKTTSTVDYWMVDLFDMAFHLRFDSRRSDPKYVKAVVTALRYLGKMGFWETFLTKKIYDELVKEEGPSFCRHISPEIIRQIRSRKKAVKPVKETKQSKREDRQKLLRSEELLQALQASHYIFCYGNAPVLSLTHTLPCQIVEDYLGSLRCASRNSAPLFEDGSGPDFGPAAKYDIDPEVMGSNEIYIPDGEGFSPPEIIDANNIPPRDEVVNPRQNADDDDMFEEKPPVMEPFSEIDAMRRDYPNLLPPKKRLGFKVYTPKPPGSRRYYT
ncbi:hypothetical protein Q1695_001548 [Nippostrongylus brasiliensis]|nr:hypothetical protein Q1695_001548 [Nippostrongylus brasiliensis]